MSVLTQCQQAIHAIPEANAYWLAYSGGVDSHVLLHLVQRYFSADQKQRLTILHVNHGLSPAATRWEQHCIHICQSLQLPYRVSHLNMQCERNVEAMAREQRYAVFAQHMQTGDCLLMAHHQEDQAETALLQLLRGAGVKGIAAMPTVRPFAGGVLVRPLLQLNRRAIAAYAVAHQLNWIEDESNTSTRFDRNYVRHQVMPVLQQRWPEAVTTLHQLTQHCAETDGLLRDLADLDWQQCRGSVPHTVSVTQLCRLNQPRQANVLRYWLQQLRLPMPNRRKLGQIQHTVLTSRWDAQPVVMWQGVQIRRYRDDLYALSDDVAQVSTVHFDGRWNITTPLVLPIGVLTAKQVLGKGVYLSDDQHIYVRFRQGGEACRLANRSGTRTLKKLWQEWSVPPWKRGQIPLIFDGETLACVVGYADCAGFQPKANQYGWEISLCPLQ